MAEESFTRRNLPHWYVPDAIHFVTFRLAGTLPRKVVDDLQAQKERLLRQKKTGQSESIHRESVHKRLFATYDKYGSSG
jgi:hypothetical protein